MKRLLLLSMLLGLAGCSDSTMTSPGSSLLPGEPTTGRLPTPAQVGTCPWIGDRVAEYIKDNPNLDTTIILLAQTGQRVYIYKVPGTGYRWEETKPGGCKGQVDNPGPFPIPVLPAPVGTAYLSSNLPIAPSLICPIPDERCWKYTGPRRRML